MPKASTDRNLLFGILAVQMDFISRDALIAAMNAWVLDKNKPLGAILVDQETLEPGRRMLLEALVDEHLKAHGDDAEKSLAAIGSVVSVRSDLEQIADTGVQATLAFLPSPSGRGVGSETKEHGTPTGSYVGTSTSSGLRFRILRPHKKGGLGEVFVAHDEELHREVALKEIQDRHAYNEESRSRFLLEAEITGGLEHPCIVPVYGLGQYVDGRPFYAMRFIRGDSLLEAIKRYHNPSEPERQRGTESDRTLDLRQLLKRFTDVCQAIQYAHDRGILHRDLKPGNIMLGKYGETLVVDWGLAKTIGRAEPRERTSIHDEPTLHPEAASGVTPTMFGSALGTPQYMSPEQAAGRVDLLGPASDVYSLGATLYCLLTGKAPVEGRDAAIVMQKVQQADFPRPRQIKPDTDAALEAICLKSMALDAADRYATPRALADDIDHWLADKPVSAYAEPFAVRARRWMRQHRTFVSSTVAVVLVGTVGSIIAAVLLAGVNVQLDSSNKQLVLTSKDADEKRQYAEREQAGSQAVREFLLNDLLRQASPAHQANTVAALRDARFKTTENPTVKELLDRAAAGLAPDKIEQKFPNQPYVHADLLHAVGDAYGGVGDHAKAIAHKVRALAIFIALYGPDEQNSLYVMQNLASSYQAAGKLDLAVPLYEEAFNRTKAKYGPDDRRTLHRLGGLASGYVAAGKLDLALKLLEELRQFKNADCGSSLRNTLITMDNLGVEYQKAGRLDLALPLIEKALDLSIDLLGADDIDTLINMNNLAKVYWNAKKPDRALPLYEDALKGMRTKPGPDHPHTQTIMANLARFYKENGKLELAVPLFEEALQLKMVKPGPDHADTLAAMRELAKAYLDGKQPRKALPLYGDLIAADRKRLGGNDLRFADVLASTSLDLLNAGEFPEAEKLLRECLAIRAKNAPDLWSTFNAKSMLGGTLLGQKKYADAESLLFAGYDGLRERQAKIPDAGKVRLAEAESRLAELFEATRTKDETKLQGKLEGAKTEVVHDVKLTAGKPLVIEMQSKEFNTFLRLQDAQGKTLVENDDIDFPNKNTSTNSRILFIPKEDGVYRVIATSCQQKGRGDYDLIIRQYSPVKGK
jgi:eukaryotic-like serine/threonine-protein kinase